MIKLFLKVICVMLLLIISVSLSLVSANGYTSYNYSAYSTCDNVKLAKNKEQVYLIGADNKTVYIDAIFPHSNNISITLDNTIHAFSLCDNTLVMVCNKDSSKLKEIFLYHIDTDTIESFNIVYEPDAIDDCILYDQTYVYVPLKSGKIKQYSTRGKLIKAYDTKTPITSLTLDYNGVVYAVGDSCFHLIRNSCYSIINTDYHLTHIYFIDDNIFVDDFGGFYKINSSQIIKIASHNSYFTDLSGGIYNNYAITFDKDTVYAINTTTGKLERKHKLDSNIKQVFSLGDDIFVFTYSGVTPFVIKVNFSELINIPQQNNNSNNTASTSTIYSDVYTFDYENSVISDVEPATTVAQFKKNLSYSGFDIKLYKYNNNATLTSGAVGTGTKVTFTKDNSTHNFTLTIKGDLTGEGNINSRDKSVIFKHLLNKSTLSDVFISAGDIDSDKEIDVCDIILMLRLIE